MKTIEQLDQETRLVTLLNEAWATLDEKPTYGEFNRVFRSTAGYGALEALEMIQPKLGITPVGMTTLSLIATITDVLCDRRLAAICEGDATDSPEEEAKRKILSWEFASY
jgi:hypothetical protein